MIDLVRSVDIDAPPHAVWEVLTDLAAFGAWNPFIREASGELGVGGEVRLHVHSGLRLPLAFRAIVTELEPERELRWKGHSLAPWLGAGDHVFKLEPLGASRTRFTQGELFTGVLPRLFGRLFEGEVGRGFDAMNRALKARAEGATPAAQDAPSARA